MIVWNRLIPRWNSKNNILSIRKYAFMNYIDDSNASEYTKNVMKRDMVLIPNVITFEEEEKLVQELEPLFKRLLYEDSHIDHVITRFREVLVQWDKAKPILYRTCCETILKYIQRYIHTISSSSLLQIHVLDMARDSNIGPHIDHIHYSGRLIAALSLLSDRVIRFRNSKNIDDIVDIMVPSRSIYLQKDSLRYEYTHEILKDGFFLGKHYISDRRLVIILRDSPNSYDQTE